MMIDAAAEMLVVNGFLGEGGIDEVRKDLQGLHSMAIFL